MAHDLITIYWVKAVEYVLAVAYLPAFFLFWKFASPKRLAAAPARAAAPGWADQLSGFFQVPPTLFFHPGHTWVRLDDHDTVTVGISDFAQKLVGPLDRIQLPAVGASLAQGEPALALGAAGVSVPMLSPVDGTVIAVNPRPGGTPGVVNDSPYGDGWLLRVRGSRLAGNLTSLMSGSLARKWMDTVCDTLGAEMAPRELGQVYLDGGQLVDGVARSLSPEDWERLARRFFLTANGGRHA